MPFFRKKINPIDAERLDVFEKLPETHEAVVKRNLLIEEEKKCHAALLLAQKNRFVFEERVKNELFLKFIESLDKTTKK